MGLRGQGAGVEDGSERESVDSSPAREWLVTDARGGYASGTVVGLNTRRYHGLLVAPLAPPLGRTVLLAQVEDSLSLDGQTFPLAVNEFEDGTVHPEGSRYLTGFSLEEGVPTWRYATGAARLERRVWMAQGRTATFVRYTLLGDDFGASHPPDVPGASGAAPPRHPARLALLPLCTFRDFHRETAGSEDWHLGVERHEAGLTVLAYAGAIPYHLLVTPPLGRAWAYETPDGQPGWWWRFLHRAERERGLDCVEDLYAVGTIACDLAPGESLLLTATIEPPPWDSLASSLPPGPGAPPPGPQDGGDGAFLAQLERAASQFLVARPDAGEPGAETVIAGYHWFGERGRDTMVALPGLARATGRYEEAAGILRDYARYVDRGMLPDRFPDSGAPLTEADYSAADASLWYFRAIDRIDRRLGGGLAESLLPVLAEILDWHIWGTRHGIRVDPHDGLLRVEHGQLTWMDAGVGGAAVTPRAGKPVELAALWHHALGLTEGWCRRSGRGPQAQYYAEIRRRAEAGFRARYWYPEGGYLYDVVDGPGGDDASLRPNQIIAAALPDCPLSTEQRRATVDLVVERLWTPRGLRTLDRDDPRYRERYGGDPAARDGAYHQGTVWSWLLGSLADAHLLAFGDRPAARRLVAPLRDHLFAEAGCGSVSEVFDGDPPHTPGGCIARAWSVAEVYRAWRETE